MTNTETKLEDAATTVPSISPLCVIHSTEEGVIEIDRVTGIRLTRAVDCPVWAQGLSTAMLAERIGFYEGRLGKEGAAATLSFDTLDYDDLSWVGVSNEGQEVEIAANFEYRTAILAELLGVDAFSGVPDGGRLIIESVTDMMAPNAGDEPLMSTSELVNHGTSNGEVEKKTGTA